jgi:hypothetical protein
MFLRRKREPDRQDLRDRGDGGWLISFIWPAWFHQTNETDQRDQPVRVLHGLLLLRGRIADGAAEEFGCGIEGGAGERRMAVQLLSYLLYTSNLSISL